MQGAAMIRWLYFVMFRGQNAYSVDILWGRASSRGDQSCVAERGAGSKKARRAQYRGCRQN